MPKGFQGFQKGHSSFLTEDAKRRISETCKKRGVGKWMRGRTLSRAIRRKQSENNARYWLGKKRTITKEWRKNLSNARKGKMPKNWSAIKYSTKGKFGKEHPVWVENKKVSLYQAIHQLYQYGRWRFAIFSRDNFTCVLCKKKASGRLEADHYPKYFANIIAEYGIKSIDEAIVCKELWDINNGRTLCKDCHQKTPNYFWRARLKRF